MIRSEFWVVLTLGLALVGVRNRALGDEGMWLFNNPPKEYLKKTYGFEPDQAWLDHVQKSSVRFNSGGSGSFVSPDGLVMTNHHVAADAIQKLSNQENNYLRDGFHARTRSEEKKCVDLELNVLQSIEDVTAAVNAAVKPGMSPEQANAARRGVTAEIEKASLEKTGLRSDVVTLYNGAQYHLYRYKKYTDVRLVFAPEQQIAFFGGDPDNFEYPRYDLDFTFFRVYENDKPVKLEHYLKWSKNGAAENELVFVSGHPGRTSRLNTVAELEYLRDTAFPFLMQRLYRMETNLKVFSDRNSENARRAKDELFGIQNSRKARDGGLAGLLDPALMARKRAQEQKIRDAVKSNPELADVVDAWDRIEAATKKQLEMNRPYAMLEMGAGFNSIYFKIGRTLLRANAEKGKPNGERLREFRDSGLESLEQELFSAEPIYPDLEIVKLSDALTHLASELGTNSPVVQAVLNGKSPRLRAAELVTATKLGSIDIRKKLYAASSDELAAAKEPFVELARLIDEESRALRKKYESEIDEVKRQANSQIAKARYAVEGDRVYPDATFTLRLAFGTVNGFEENGKKVPYVTNFAGLYEHSNEHQGQPPYDLPKRWLDRKDKLDLKVPFNFVCTADIIGGNSGSPVINRNAEVVGLIFDGNIQSLVLDFSYDDVQARAVSVHSAGMIEALKKIYEADELVQELLGTSK
ncbi:S46 family peptidase [Tuwongella immobilis]|uniref:Dipeptidyl-peptidase n=1 Tax=Tuwongella immobilis TaxID=692036 RepID=A0A6C2YPP3_9BACT|nr:S46 family peptidase [Tuwongella immobilis]VIP03598.1 peptidase s46 : Uncharacterized protein OS=Opitutus terrae (strain DSM 11246 / PB90-1) GN=Oter_0618 PE=4 SV=1: Peptidase_S46 [Tuwongella immobilis]VTS04564.1 peptidase s46 : Uncharacterized protein OS=Opitutus terrae (strain DSM 11246 / PB90-1) GN=Oter_0618 PE=4 SV=1: Peptidase_S46 [Tuwongella immobilis]